MLPPWIHRHEHSFKFNNTWWYQPDWNIYICLKQKGNLPQVEDSIFFQHPSQQLGSLRISSLAELRSLTLLRTWWTLQVEIRDLRLKRDITLKKVQPRVFFLFGFFVCMMILSLKYIQQKMLKMEDLVAHIEYVTSSKKMVFILIGSTSHQKLNICTRASCPAASISTCGSNRPLLVMIRFGSRVWRAFEKYKAFVSLRSTKYNTFSYIITQTKPWSI